MSVTVVNLEQGKPTVEVARIRLDQALRAAKDRDYSGGNDGITIVLL